MLDFKTINGLFERMSHRGDTTVVLTSNRGEWTPITSQQMYGRVRATVELLRSWGIQRGDRVGIISENRWEWPVADFAVLAIGAVDVPLYQTSSAEQMGFILRDAGVRAVFVSSKGNYAKLVAAGAIPTLEHVAVFEEGSFDNSYSFPEWMQRAPALEQLWLFWVAPIVGAFIGAHVFRLIRGKDE